MVQMNKFIKSQTVMIMIAFFTIVRSIYLICLTVFIFKNSNFRLVFVLVIVFVIFENYCILSCLVKKKKKIIVEIELTLICFFYVFSFGYSFAYMLKNSMPHYYINMIVSVLYVLCIEIFKILYMKTEIPSSKE